MISLHSIQKQFGEKILYNTADLAIHEGGKYGLVGRNGAGKSLLFRFLTHEDIPDSGRVVIPENLSLAHLPQEVEEYDQRQTPLEVVLEPFHDALGDDDVFEAVSQSSQRDLTDNMERLSRYIDTANRLDVYSLEGRAASILAGLGISQKQIGEPMQYLSGGFRMRVFLAKILLAQPDFILLDEPTNHLDMDSLIWLERFLKNFSGGCMIISHDTAFLDRIIDTTVEVFNHRLYSYSGTVSAYFSWKKEQARLEKKQRENLQDKITQLEEFVARFKSKATKAAQARSKMKQLDRLREQLPAYIQGDKDFSFRLPPASHCGSLPLGLEKVNAGYDFAPVLKNLSLNIHRGDKIAVIGPNGAGKSTFLRVCSGELEPFSGEVKRNPRAEVRLFNQYRAQELDVSLTLYETVVHHTGENRPTEIRTMLGSFLFSGEEVDKTVSVLSGGEKSRLSLLLLLARPGNVLLLDEPTNHLDAQSVEALGNALAEYDGTVVTVSHDEHFIQSIANRIVEIRPGIVRDFPGNLGDYRHYIEDTLFSDTDAPGSKQEDRDKEERKKLYAERRQLKRKIEKREREIEDLEAKIENEEQVLLDPGNGQDHTLLADSQKKIDRWNARLEKFLEEWELLQTEYAVRDGELKKQASGSP
jgi:ATP-binding cassette subfamily F protein 3